MKATHTARGSSLSVMTQERWDREEWTSTKLAEEALKLFDDKTRQGNPKWQIQNGAAGVVIEELYGDGKLAHKMVIKGVFRGEPAELRT